MQHPNAKANANALARRQANAAPTEPESGWMITSAGRADERNAAAAAAACVNQIAVDAIDCALALED